MSHTIHCPDGFNYEMDDDTYNHFQGRPRGTVRAENHLDGTGVHYYDGAGNELHHPQPKYEPWDDSMWVDYY